MALSEKSEFMSGKVRLISKLVDTLTKTRLIIYKAENFSFRAY